MNVADVQVDLFDVWGRSLRGGRIEVEEKRGAGGSHFLAIAEVPGFKRDSAVLDFKGRAAMTLIMDPDECDVMDQEAAAVALFDLKMTNAWVAGRRIRSFVADNPVHVQPDRAFYLVDHDLAELVGFSGAYHDAPGGMHSPPPGFAWEPDGSVKSHEPFLNVQLTFWIESARRMFVEVDLDLNSGIRHTFDALIRHPLTGQDDPRVLAQLLVFYQGLQLPFSMTPRASS